MRYCPNCQRCFHDGVEFCLFDQTPTRTGAGLPLVIDEKYQLECLLAHGGMGSVFRARHLQLERPVAVKILRAEFLTDATVRERFHREALAAARLKHPNIIAIYDFGSLANGCAYIVMELVEGRSLRAELRLAHGQMRPARAAAIMQQVCAGIEAAHRHGIIHRDLKPDNIMIEAAVDGGERILVLDFGIAKLKQPEGIVQCLTDEETVIGTPNYISPEQCTGLPVDARSDVYALGVILYEMLTGRVPFSDPSTSVVLLSHLQEPPAPPSRFRPDLNPAVEQVILRALAKSPQHRYASAAQFAESLLEAVTAPEPAVSEEPETRPRQLRPLLVGAIAAPAEPDWRTLLPSTYVRKVEIAETAEGEESAAAAQASTVLPPEREPQLLLERRPRRALFLVIGALSLLAVGVLGDFNTGGRLSRLARTAATPATSPATRAQRQIEPSPTPAASLTPAVIAALPDEAGNTGAAALSSTPETLVKTAATVSEAEQRAMLREQVKTAYRRWVETAMKLDWKAHARFYAAQVSYYNEGLIPVAQVLTRKRRVFDGLDKYYLRFDGEPQIVFNRQGEQPEAHLTFDKQWDLQRARQRTAGKALTQVVLRYNGERWLIIGEKQLKLYAHNASAAAPPATGKQAAVKSARPRAGTKVRSRAAKNRKR